MQELVFISYSSKDRKIADAVVGGLEQRSVRCWIAPRDIEPGQEWADAIMSGIKRATCMVIVFSDSANQSKQVLREVERAINHGLTVIPFRVEDIQPSGAMEYFLTVPHWLDAMTGPMEASIERLHAALPSNRGGTPAPLPAPVPAPVSAPSGGRKGLLIAFVLALLVAAGAGGFWWSQQQAPPAIVDTPKTAPPVSAPVVDPKPDPLRGIVVTERDNLSATALASLESVRSLRERMPARRINLKVWVEPERGHYVEGDRFAIKLSADKDSYVAVFVHSADGATVLVYPNEFDDGVKARAGELLTLGDGNSAFEFEVQPPWGVDVIHALASSNRDAMVALLKDATPIEGTPYRVLDREVLTRGIGVVAASKPGDSGEAGGSSSGEWGDAVYAVRTGPRS